MSCAGIEYVDMRTFVHLLMSDRVFLTPSILTIRYQLLRQPEPFRSQIERGCHAVTPLPLTR